MRARIDATFEQEPTQNACRRNDVAFEQIELSSMRAERTDRECVFGLFFRKEPENVKEEKFFE